MRMRRVRTARGRLLQAFVALGLWTFAVGVVWSAGGWRLGVAAILGTFAINLSEDLRQ